MDRSLIVFTASLLLLVNLVLGNTSAFAVILPGPADINRIAPGPQVTPQPPPKGQSISIEPPPASGTPVPRNAIAPTSGYVA